MARVTTWRNSTCTLIISGFKLIVVVALSECQDVCFLRTSLLPQILKALNRDQPNSRFHARDTVHEISFHETAATTRQQSI